MKKLNEDGLTWWEQIEDDHHQQKELKQMIEDVNRLTESELEESIRINREVTQIKQNLVEYHNGKRLIQKQIWKI